MLDQWLFIAQGMGVTLSYTFMSLIVGCIGGLVFAIARQHWGVRWVIDGLVSLIRGTPLLLQLSLFYFSLPTIIGVRLSLFEAGILAFGLNSTAYITEILRGGIQSIPQGQFEISQSLGIPKFLMWRDIIMPQVMVRVFPSLINEVISLLKETAVISMLGGMDIMKRAQSIAAQSFDYFGPLILAGLCYYVLVLGIEALGKYAERKWFHASYS